MKRLLSGAAAALLALTSAGALARPADAVTENWPEVFDPAILRTLNVQMTSQDWDFIRKDLTETYRPGYLSADGEAPIYVAVRRKSSRALPSETNPIKVGLKIDINEYVDGQTWHGLTKLSLENGADSGVVEEGLAWAMHRMAGSPMNGFAVAYANWVKVNINGTYIGLYVNAEQRDKQALRQRELWQGGSTWLYEQDQAELLLEEGDPDSPGVRHLCYSPFRLKGKGTCVVPQDAALEADLQAWLDMDAFVSYCAVETLTGNTDGLCSKSHNAFFVDFSEERMATGFRRVYLPWDLDTVFGDTLANNIYSMKGGRRLTQSPYEAVILNHAVFRADYNARILSFTDIEGPLSMAAMEALLDQVAIEVGPAADAEPYPSTRGVRGDTDALLAWLTQRYANARAQALANTNPPPRS